MCAIMTYGLSVQVSVVTPGLNTGHAPTSHFPDRCSVVLFSQVGKILTAEGDMLMLDSHPLLPVMTSTPPLAPEPAVASYMPVINVAPMTIPVDFANKGAEQGLRILLRLLILECELVNHLDKAANIPTWL